MATVRMSDKLKWATVDEAERQFENVNKKKEISLDIGDAIYTKYVLPVVETSQSFIVKHSNVKNFIKLDTSSSLQVGFVIPAHDDQTEMTYSSSNTIEMSAERTIPSSTNNNYHNHISFYIPHDCEEAIQIKEIRDHNEDIATRAYEYRNKVSDTLDNFTTVNQALKAWPALEKLITDSWVLQRVNEKVQRRKKQDEQRAEIELNETDLNSVILTNALIGDD
mgnify:FL=1|tara:strand:- start:83 stop:748 length:666 start_codon:yes stop_codon:yes gene_type:complete